VAFTSAVFRLLITLSFVPLAAAQDRADPARVDELVVQQTNDFRRSEGRPTLERDDGLGRIAREFVSFIARTGKYSHEADGSTPSGRARRGGYDFCLISENLAYQYNSTGFTTRELAKKLVEGWKNSAGHRKNMLDRDALHTAVAVGRGEKNGYYYAVQLFARPRSASVDFEVRNATRENVRYRVDDRSFTLSPGAIREHKECAPEALHFDEPAGANSPATEFTTRKGDKFVVVRERGGEAFIKRE
jgi:uncharacterized protein YkwD